MMNKEARIALIMAAILIGFAVFANASTFSDMTASNFNNGTYANTTYNGTAVVLSGTNTSGAFTSRVFDAGQTAITWNNISLTSATPAISYFATIDNNADVWISVNAGVNWTKANDDYNNGAANGGNGMARNSTNSIFAADGQDIWVSNNKGTNWTKINDDYNGGETNNAVSIGIDSSNNLFVIEGDLDVWKSINSGASFSKVNGSDFNGGNNNNVFGIVGNSSGAIFTADTSSDVWMSSNSGVSWTLAKDDYNAGATNGGNDIAINSSNALFIVDNQDLWTSVDNGASWTKVNDDFNGGGDSSSGTKMILDTNNYIYIIDASQDVYKSTDSGLTFSLAASNINSAIVNVFGAVNVLGSTNLTIQARNCSSADCSDGTFANVNQNSINLTGRYFQYKAYFTTENGAVSPMLYNVTIDYSITDSTPPATIATLQNQSQSQTWIYWNWTNPSDSDFSQAIVYINSVNVANTSNNYYNATGLTNNTGYTITVHTKDTNGNVNTTDVNSTARTLAYNLAPSTTIPSISPATAYRNSDLNCTFTITDEDAGDSLTANYTWYNGTSSVISGSLAVTNGTEKTITLNSGNLTKNEVWNCSIIPYDGQDYGNAKSAAKTISNSLPTAPIVDILPASPGDDEDLVATIATASTDADNDTITYAYQWYKNDTIQVGQTSNTLSKLLTSVGEIWKCIVTPNDGTGNGAAAQDNVTISSSDTTAPVITLISPSNGTSLSAGTTSAYINISTNEIAECRYNETNSTFSFAEGVAFNETNNLTHSFLFEGLSDGQSYTLYYKCNDTIGNLNSASTLHSFSVLSALYCGDGSCNNGESCSSCSADCGTCSSGGGGGGGSRRTTPAANQTNATEEQEEVTGIGKVDFGKIQTMIVNPGESKKISLSIKNVGDIFLNRCRLKGTGENAAWVKAEGTKDMSVGQIAEFVVQLSVPADAKASHYSIGVEIECQEISQSTAVSAEIIEKKMIIEFLEAKKKDGKLSVRYSISELTGQNQEVDIEILLTGESGEKVAGINEKKSLNADSKQIFESTIDISNARENTLNILINAKSATASAFVQEALVLNQNGFSGFATLTGEEAGNLGVAVLVIGFIVFAFVAVRRIMKYSGIHSRKNIISAIVAGIGYYGSPDSSAPHNN